MLDKEEIQSKIAEIEGVISLVADKDFLPTKDFSISHQMIMNRVRMVRLRELRAQKKILEWVLT